MIMKKLVLSFISSFSLLFVCILFHSCSSCSSSDENENDKRAEYAKIAENRNAQDLLDDLFIGSDGDGESLARMLGVTPSTINRIRKGKSEATPKFEEKIREVTVYYYQNDQSFIKLRSVIDEEWGWYDSILNFSSLHPFWFWGLIVLLIIINNVFWIDTDSDLLGKIASYSCLVGLIAIILLLIPWSCSYFFSPSPMEDKYQEIINPVVEQLT